jgi:hypothetical protein
MRKYWFEIMPGIANETQDSVDIGDKTTSDLRSIQPIQYIQLRGLVTIAKRIVSNLGSDNHDVQQRVRENVKRMATDDREQKFLLDPQGFPKFVSKYVNGQSILLTTNSLEALRKNEDFKPSKSNYPSGLDKDGTKMSASATEVILKSEKGEIRIPKELHTATVTVDDKGIREETILPDPEFKSTSTGWNLTLEKSGAAFVRDNNYIPRTANSPYEFLLKWLIVMTPTAEGSMTEQEMRSWVINPKLSLIQSEQVLTVIYFWVLHHACEHLSESGDDTGIETTFTDWLNSWSIGQITVPDAGEDDDDFSIDKVEPVFKKIRAPSWVSKMSSDSQKRMVYAEQTNGLMMRTDKPNSCMEQSDRNLKTMLEKAADMIRKQVGLGSIQKSQGLKLLIAIKVAARIVPVTTGSKVIMSPGGFTGSLMRTWWIISVLEMHPVHIHRLMPTFVWSIAKQFCRKSWAAIKDMKVLPHLGSWFKCRYGVHPMVTSHSNVDNLIKNKIIWTEQADWYMLSTLRYRLELDPMPASNLQATLLSTIREKLDWCPEAFEIGRDLSTFVKPTTKRGHHKQLLKLNRLCSFFGCLERPGFVGYPHASGMSVIGLNSTEAYIRRSEKADPTNEKFKAVVADLLNRVPADNAKGRDIITRLIKFTSAGVGNDFSLRLKGFTIDGVSFGSDRGGRGDDFGLFSTRAKTLVFLGAGHLLMSSDIGTQIGTFSTPIGTGSREDVMKKKRMIYLIVSTYLAAQSPLKAALEHFESSPALRSHFPNKYSIGNVMGDISRIFRFSAQANGMANVSEDDGVKHTVFEFNDFPNWDAHVRAMVLGALADAAEAGTGPFHGVDPRLRHTFVTLIRRTINGELYYSVSDGDAPRTLIPVQHSSSGDAYTTLLNSFVHYIIELLRVKLQIAWNDSDISSRKDGSWCLNTFVPAELIVPIPGEGFTILGLENAIVVFGDDGIGLTDVTYDNEPTPDDILEAHAVSTDITSLAYRSCGFGMEPSDVGAARLSAVFLNFFFYGTLYRRWRDTLSGERELADDIRVWYSRALGMPFSGFPLDAFVRRMMMASMLNYEVVFGRVYSMPVDKFFLPSETEMPVSAIPFTVNPKAYLTIHSNLLPKVISLRQENEVLDVSVGEAVMASDPSARLRLNYASPITLFWRENGHTQHKTWLARDEIDMKAMEAGILKFKASKPGSKLANFSDIPLSSMIKISSTYFQDSVITNNIPRSLRHVAFNYATENAFKQGIGQAIKGEPIPAKRLRDKALRNSKLTEKVFVPNKQFHVRSDAYRFTVTLSSEVKGTLWMTDDYILLFKGMPSAGAVPTHKFDILDPVMLGTIESQVIPQMSFGIHSGPQRGIREPPGVTGTIMPIPFDTMMREASIFARSPPQVGEPRGFEPRMRFALSIMTGRDIAASESNLKNIRLSRLQIDMAETLDSMQRTQAPETTPSFVVLFEALQILSMTAEIDNIMDSIPDLDKGKFRDTVLGVIATESICDNTVITTSLFHQNAEPESYFDRGQLVARVYDFSVSVT